jgi:hypothetical protein
LHSAVLANLIKVVLLTLLLLTKDF